MTWTVRAQFRELESLQPTLHALLQHGFTTDQIVLRTRLSSPSPPVLRYGGDRDPLGGARLAQRVVSTMSATGHNLVGNSALVDTELGQIGSLLDFVATTQGKGDPQVVVDVAVKAETKHAARQAADIMHKGEGVALRTDRRNRGSSMN